MTAFIERKKTLIKHFIALGCNINAKDLRGLTALHLAAMYNEKDILQLILENSPEIDIQYNQGNTPLWRAIMSNDDSAEVIDYLIKQELFKIRLTTMGLRLENY